jgi:hypothetical protein
MEKGYTTCFSGSAIIRLFQVQDPGLVLEGSYLNLDGGVRFKVESQGNLQ